MGGLRREISAVLRPASRRPSVWLLALAAAALMGSACATRGAGPSGGAQPSAVPPVVKAPSNVGDMGPRAYARLNRDLTGQLEAVRFDCAKVAETLRTWTQAHASALRSAIDEVDRWEKRARQADIAAYYRRVFPDISLRVEIGTHCDAHTTVRTAFDAFFTAVGLDEG